MRWVQWGVRGSDGRTEVEAVERQRLRRVEHRERTTTVAVARRHEQTRTLEVAALTRKVQRRLLLRAHRDAAHNTQSER